MTIEYGLALQLIQLQLFSGYIPLTLGEDDK